MSISKESQAGGRTIKKHINKMRDPRAILEAKRARLIGNIFLGTALVIDIVVLVYLVCEGILLLPVYFFIVVPVSMFMIKMILLIPMMILKSLYKNAESIFW